MKVLTGIFAALALLPAALPAWADPACQKCTHDFQVQYRECRAKGKDQETCSKEQQTAVQACLVICQASKVPDEKTHP